jgi:hypothetical protein
MLTYRRDRARDHWHRPWPIRVLSLLLGLVLFIVGGVAWSLEDVYGGDPDRQEYVIGPEGVIGENGEVVYETTDMMAAEEWAENQRGGRNYIVPFLLLMSSALLFLVAVAPSPTKRDPEAAIARNIGTIRSDATS